jgi:hypothetical protein
MSELERTRSARRAKAARTPGPTASSTQRSNGGKVRCRIRSHARRPTNARSTTLDLISCVSTLPRCPFRSKASSDKARACSSGQLA